MKRRFCFLSGLPRCGSTVLNSLLAQSVDLHTTSTSVVKSHLDHIYNFHLGESPYYSTSMDSPVWDIMRGVLNGTYLSVGEGKTVIEKDRHWPSNLKRLHCLLQEKPKIIAVVRPIPEIISSFVLLCQRQRRIGTIDRELLDLGRQISNTTRSRVIWEKYIYQDWRALKSGFEHDPSCFLVLDYHGIVNEAQTTVDRICDFIEVDRFQVRTSQLINPNPENDSIYGLDGLHDVRAELKENSPPAIEVLGEQLFCQWADKNLEFW